MTQDGCRGAPAELTWQPAAAEPPRTARDAAGKCRRPSARPDAVAAWRGSPANTPGDRRAAGTGFQVAAGWPQQCCGREVSDGERAADSDLDAPARSG